MIKLGTKCLSTKRAFKFYGLVIHIYIYIIYWDLDSIIYTKSRKFGEKREP
jgi:hypothetical protein